VVCGGVGYLCRGAVSDGSGINLVCSWGWLSSFMMGWLSLVVVDGVIVMVDVISGLPLCCFLSWDFCCFGAIGVFGGQLYFVMVSSVSVVVRFLAIVDSDC